MGDRELSDQVKALNKALAESVSPSIIVGMLDGFKTRAAPSEQALRATKAGVTVGRLRSNKNQDIASAASAVVKKWKESVDASKTKKINGNTAASSPRPESGTASPAAANGTSAASKPFKGDPEKRKYQTDGVNINRTDQALRNNSIGLIYNGLAYRCTASVETVLDRAVLIEHAADKEYKYESEAYKTKIRSLFQNLKSKSNRELSKRVMSGNIKPEEFVRMTHDELKSEEQRSLEERLEKENMNKAQVAMPEKSVSDALTCGKCGKKQVSYTQAQTRSADEPMTTFCECLVCGNRWKFS